MRKINKFKNKLIEGQTFAFYFSMSHPKSPKHSSLVRPYENSTAAVVSLLLKQH